MAQRVADLLADGADPSSIVAFTFTGWAADALKSRIEKRVAVRLGQDVLDSLNGMFVGTIHSYCFSVLQQHVPKYETFDVLDDHRLMGKGIGFIDAHLLASVTMTDRRQRESGFGLTCRGHLTTMLAVPADRCRCRRGRARD